MGSAQPGGGSGRTLGKGGSFSIQQKNPTALLHSAAPNSHILEPNRCLSGTGAAWARCLPLTLAGRVGVF